MKKTYGILGGYGAVATLRFQHMIINETLAQGRYKDEDFPRYILTNLPYNIITEKGMIPQRQQLETFLRNSALHFTAAEQVYILCNTFHIAEDTLEKAFGTQLVSLPEITKQEIKKQNLKRVLIVGSVPTIDHKLYHDPAYESIDTPVLLLIEEGMKGFTDSNKLQELVHTAERFAADGIVLACTDLSIFAPKLRTLTQLPIVDSLEVAAGHLLQTEKEN